MFLRDGPWDVERKFFYTLRLDPRDGPLRVSDGHHVIRVLVYVVTGAAHGTVVGEVSSAPDTPRLSVATPLAIALGPNLCGHPRDLPVVVAARTQDQLSCCWIAPPEDAIVQAFQEDRDGVTARRHVDPYDPLPESLDPHPTAC